MYFLNEICIHTLHAYFSTECAAPSQESAEAKRTSKKPKTSTNLADSLFEQFGAKRLRTEDDELVRYENMPADVRNEDVLSWWKTNEKVFPRLSFLARQYLATPATSASSERVFSSAGRTITDLRSRLSSQTLADFLYVHYNC